MSLDADGHELIAAARDLARFDGGTTVIGCWQRAAALLARQGIEEALRDLWDLRSPAMTDVSTRCQLLCLGSFLRDSELAGRVHVAWEGLSRACHVRVYELPPTASELDGWMRCGWELCDVVARELLSASPGRG
ncbi:MAG: hypothetical protein ACYDAC_06965 [Candidatus Dormibacteria bacterium]